MNETAARGAPRDSRAHGTVLVARSRLGPAPARCFSRAGPGVRSREAGVLRARTPEAPVAGTRRPCQVPARAGHPRGARALTRSPRGLTDRRARSSDLGALGGFHPSSLLARRRESPEPGLGPARRPTPGSGSRPCAPGAAAPERAAPALTWRLGALQSARARAPSPGRDARAGGSLSPRIPLIRGSALHRAPAPAPPGRPAGILETVPSFSPFIPRPGRLETAGPVIAFFGGPDADWTTANQGLVYTR